MGNTISDSNNNIINSNNNIGNYIKNFELKSYKPTEVEKNSDLQALYSDTLIKRACCTNQPNIKIPIAGVNLDSSNNIIPDSDGVVRIKNFAVNIPVFSNKSDINETNCNNLPLNSTSNGNFIYDISSNNNNITAGNLNNSCPKFYKQFATDIINQRKNNYKSKDNISYGNLPDTSLSDNTKEINSFVDLNCINSIFEINKSDFDITDNIDSQIFAQTSDLRCKNNLDKTFKNNNYEKNNKCFNLNQSNNINSTNIIWSNKCIENYELGINNSKESSSFQNYKSIINNLKPIAVIVLNYSIYPGSVKLDITVPSNIIIGSYVVINPNTNIEEIRKIIGFGSIILDSPLLYSHPIGTIINIYSPNNINNNINNSFYSSIQPNLYNLKNNLLESESNNINNSFYSSIQPNLYNLKNNLLESESNNIQTINKNNKLNMINDLVTTLNLPKNIQNQWKL